MSRFRILLTVLLGFIMCSTATHHVATDNTDGLREVGRYLLKFSASLHKKISSDVVDLENKVISPLSVAAVLSMIHPAAKGNTSDQLKDTLHLPKDLDVQVFAEKLGNLLMNSKGGANLTLEAANRVYASMNCTVLESYQTLLKKSFGIAAETLDFGESDKATTAINDWVDEVTHHKIQNLIPKGALDSFTRLVLVNAVYFKGSWKVQFDPSKTSVDPFYLGADNEPMATHMMHSYAQYSTASLSDLNARVLELPYEGNQVSMFIILPESPDDLPLIENALLSRDLLDEAQQRMETARINVAVPKFDMEFEISMKDVLKTLGLTDLFDEKQADLSGITGRKDLFVSDVFHKAFIEVNEEGCEAAAATAGVMRLKRSMEIHEPFIVNRPCIFIVQHKPSGLWLFSGRLNKPRAAEPELLQHDEF